MVARRGRTAVAGVLLAVLGGLGVRLEQVHRDTWEWRLTASPTPPRLHVLDRDYRRSGPAPAPPADAAELATAPGGARIWSTAVPGSAPTVIWAVTGAGTTAYVLMGGP